VMKIYDEKTGGCSMTYFQIETKAKEYHERWRDSTYMIAAELAGELWNVEGDEDKLGLADAVHVLLLEWNKRFYVQGKLKFEKLKEEIKNRKKDGLLNRFRELRLEDVNINKEESTIRALFLGFLDASSIPDKRVKVKGKDGKKRHKKVTARSPVSAAKALHILAPNVFPLWDTTIAEKWGCKWPSTSKAVESYIEFMRRNRRVVKELIVQHRKKNKKEPILKMLDECAFVLWVKK
jgi:hypothetical protein